MSKKRILIAEDEAMTAADLKRSLALLGYEVIGIANSAPEAVSLAGLHHPDLVLMDITLSGQIDGITAAVAIRGNPGSPVVFLTAHADEPTMKRAMLAGPFGYLIKPFEEADLKATIEVSLHKYQSEVASRSQGTA